MIFFAYFLPFYFWELWNICFITHFVRCPFYHILCLATYGCCHPSCKKYLTEFAQLGLLYQGFAIKGLIQILYHSNIYTLLHLSWCTVSVFLDLCSQNSGHRVMGLKPPGHRVTGLKPPGHRVTGSSPGCRIVTGFLFVVRSGLEIFLEKKYVIISYFRSHLVADK